MSSIANTLKSMEQLAQRATAQELCRMRAQLRSLRATLEPAELEHANALLLRLEHLEEQQTTPFASLHEASRLLAPHLVIDAAPLPAHPSAAPAAEGMPEGDRADTCACLPAPEVAPARALSEAQVRPHPVPVSGRHAGLAAPPAAQGNGQMDGDARGSTEGSPTGPGGQGEQPHSAGDASAAGPVARAAPHRGRAHPAAEIQRLAARVDALLDSGLSALDSELLQALAELGNHARSIVRTASEHASLHEILRGLHAYNLLDTTDTECDGALAALKRRARRAATGAPAALWDPHAERELLETLLHVAEEDALDHALLELAQACGYTDVLDVDWRFWHYGRHAEHAAKLGMDACLPRLLDAGWQVLHHLLPDPDGEHAQRMRMQLQVRHRQASQAAP